MTRDEMLVHLAQENVALSERVTELEIQSRFALNNQRMFKPGAIMDAKGQREMITGWDAYANHGGRAYTLTVLETEYIANIVADMAKEKVDNGDTRPVEEIIAECRTAYWQQREQREAERDRAGDGRSDPESIVNPTTGRAH
jgi:hypothetical protein